MPIYTPGLDESQDTDIPDGGLLDSNLHGDDFVFKCFVVRGAFHIRFELDGVSAGSRVLLHLHLAVLRKDELPNFALGSSTATDLTFRAFDFNDLVTFVLASLFVALVILYVVVTVPS